MLPPRFDRTGANAATGRQPGSRAILCTVARGAIRKEALVIGAVVLVATATVAYFGWRIGERRGILAEGTRMRQLYVALSVYESQADGELPPDLLAARPFVTSDRDFSSDRDPFRSAPGPFPVDAGIPDGTRRSPVRVSDAYLWAHRLAGRIPTPPWQEARMDSTLGVLANEWCGSVEPGTPFQAKVSGEVLRITTDGSIVRVRRGGPKPLGDAVDLFRRKPERR